MCVLLLCSDFSRLYVDQYFTNTLKICGQSTILIHVLQCHKILKNADNLFTYISRREGTLFNCLVQFFILKTNLWVVLCTFLLFLNVAVRYLLSNKLFTGGTRPTGSHKARRKGWRLPPESTTMEAIPLA